MTKKDIPQYEEAENMCDEGKANPLSHFVHCYEPGDCCEEWRDALWELIKHVRKLK